MGRVCRQISSLCTLSVMPALGRQIEWGAFIFPFLSFCGNSVGPFTLPATQQTVQICWRMKIFMALDLDTSQFYFLRMHPTFAVIHYKLFSEISWPDAFFPHWQNFISPTSIVQSHFFPFLPSLLLLFRPLRAEVLAGTYLTAFLCLRSPSRLLILTPQPLVCHQKTGSLYVPLLSGLLSEDTNAYFPGLVQAKVFWEL